jgi:transposase
LEAKTRALAGWKGYTTNLTTASPEFVIDAYHQLWHIEKSFRMSNHDLQARPIYHHIRESIEAHLSIVVAALAVSHWVEHQTKVGVSRNSCELPAATAPSRSAADLNPKLSQVG